MRYSFSSLARPLAVLSIALAAPSAASAQTNLDFISIACGSGMFNQAPNPYMEDGFTLFTSGPDGFGTWCEDSPNYAGPGMFINTAFATADLTKDGGATFSANAIELAQAFAGVQGPQSITFTGWLAGGGTVSQTFVIGAQLGAPEFERYEFNDLFTNLARLTFDAQEPGYYQFTNIALDLDATAIPEPASMALLGTGLIGVFGVGAMRRRRRNESA